MAAVTFTAMVAPFFDTKTNLPVGSPANAHVICPPYYEARPDSVVPPRKLRLSHLALQPRATLKHLLDYSRKQILIRNATRNIGTRLANYYAHTPMQCDTSWLCVDKTSKF